MNQDLIRELKWPVAVTLAVLIFGTAGYFGLNNGESDSMSVAVNPLDAQAFEFVKLKATYSPEGFVKLFAYTPKVPYKSSVGASSPVDGGVIIGAMEANMMIEENMFSTSGDRLQDLFGLNTTVAGILAETGGLADDLHFVSSADFEKVNGDERAFIRMKDGAPKLFYTLKENETASFTISLEKGSMDDYNEYEVAGRKYYPVIVGYEEAQMMIEEKLFSNPGDAISNFFGKDIVIVGVASQTNTSLDMMHITTLTAQDI